MAKKDELPRFLSPAQVGKIVGRSERWVQVLCGRGHLEAHRVGPRGNWQIRPEQLVKSFGLTAVEVHQAFASLRRKNGRAVRERTP